MCEKIRLAELSDVDAIIKIGRSTFSKAYGDIVRDIDMARYLDEMFDYQCIASEIADKTACYFVAERDCALVGYAKLAQTNRPEHASDENAMELLRLYIAEGEYGRGIGGKLLSAARSKAITCGCTGWWLRVWEKNISAIRFYERAGFKQRGVEPYLIGETANPVVLMYEPLPHKMVE